MVERGVGACAARLPGPPLDLLRTVGFSMDEANEASEACLEIFGRVDDRRSSSKRSEKSSALLLFLKS